MKTKLKVVELIKLSSDSKIGETEGVEKKIERIKNKVIIKKPVIKKDKIISKITLVGTLREEDRIIAPKQKEIYTERPNEKIRQRLTKEKQAIQKLDVNNCLQNENIYTAQSQEEIIKGKAKIIADIFILDTNAIMDFPELIKILVVLKKKIIVPKPVMKELTKLKKSMKEDKKEKAHNALEQLKPYKESIDFLNYDSKNSTKHWENDDDKKIGSLAIKFKDENSVLVSRDGEIHAYGELEEFRIWNIWDDIS